MSVKNANYRISSLCGGCVVAREIEPDRYGSHRRFILKIRNYQKRWRAYTELARIQPMVNNLKVVTQFDTMDFEAGDFVYLEHNHESEMIPIRKLNDEGDYEKRCTG